MQNLGNGFSDGNPQEVKTVEEFFNEKRELDLRIDNLKGFDVVFYLAKRFKNENGILTFFYYVVVGFGRSSEYGVRTFEGHAKVDIRNSISVNDTIKEIAFAINEDLLERYKKNKRRAEDYYDSLFFVTNKDLEIFKDSKSTKMFVPKVAYRLSLKRKVLFETL